LAADAPDIRVALRIIELIGITPDELSNSGPVTPEAVIDAEALQRRGRFGHLMDDEVSALERARVQQEWDALISEGDRHEK
jgi:hypothetical protein